MKVLEKDIKPYAKEWTRKHLKDLGYTTYYHPSFSSASIVVKNGIVLGMVATDRIKRDNAECAYVLNNQNFLEFIF